MKARILSLVIALVIAFAFFYPLQAQAPTSGTVNTTANLRSGPGTTYAVVGSLAAGSVVEISACNEDCTWYQVGDNVWISASLVTATSAAPIATLPPSTSANQINIVGWNVESGGALQNVVADRMGSFQDVDIWALSEVYAIDAEAFEFGAETGEGANYESYLGTTGSADRLLLIWDEDRFDLLASGSVPEIGLGARAPLWVALRETTTNFGFIVMVNHLHRSNEATRHRQAEMLNAWAASQVMPIVALGDYNFDWNLPVGETDHDAGYDNMTKDGVWEWIRPAELVTTQCSGWPCGYTSVLDFVFAAGPAREWNISSQIIVTENDFPDDNTTPDHRPVMAVIVPEGGLSAPVVPTPLPTTTTVAVEPTTTATSWTAEEQEYLNFLGSKTQLYSTALQGLSSQFLAVGETPTLLVNDEWILKTATAIAIIQVLNDDIREQVAPPRFAAVHAEMLSAASHYDLAMTLLSEGIDDLDGTKIVSAQTSMTEGNNAILRARAALLAITDPSNPVAAAPSQPACVSANTTGNLRAGPGTGYAVVGNVTTGQCITITGRTEVGDWYELGPNVWIAAFLVTNPGPMSAIPVVAVAAPTAVPVAPTQAQPTSVPQQEQPTATAIPTPVPPSATPVPQPAAPSCDPNYTGACIPQVGYDLDCPEVGVKDFRSVGSDPHGFDRDGDGLACES